MIVIIDLQMTRKRYLPDLVIEIIVHNRPSLYKPKIHRAMRHRRTLCLKMVRNAQKRMFLARVHPGPNQIWVGLVALLPHRYPILRAHVGVISERVPLDEMSGNLSVIGKPIKNRGETRSAWKESEPSKRELGATDPEARPTPPLPVPGTMTNHQAKEVRFRIASQFLYLVCTIACCGIGRRAVALAILSLQP